MDSNIICKYCGGENHIEAAVKTFVCVYCGMKNTAARNRDVTGVLFNRANHFRRNSEFDKASGIYESILNTDSLDAEAYWGLVLCKYGIEYVEDPADHKRIPTCNRTHYTSILEDGDYLSAIENADEASREIYKEEAQAINTIQKRILDISIKEKPYDVFICYKETNDAGERTPDSVLAQELYYQLIHEGFHVFFSRITLEDKLGSLYEPYIFAALNSAKVMVVVGTKPEYINSVWVKNEWGRYLALARKDEKKKLIPAYRDMDAYDLPDEFAHLQAQDMGKLGFMQDLVRGIKKIIAECSTQDGPGEKDKNRIPPLLRRAFIFLGDGDFTKADDLLEQVLNNEPESAPAYIGKLMVELQLKDEKQLAEQEKPLESFANYQKALRYADAAQKRVYEGYNRAISERIENERKEEEKYKPEFVSKMTKLEHESKTLTEEYETRRMFGGQRRAEIQEQFLKVNEDAYTLIRQYPFSLLIKYYSNKKTSDKLYFGTSHGQEAIEWRILLNEKGRMLLISERNLYCKPYNMQQIAVTWESCTLRKWLNDDFFHATFSADEQRLIELSSVGNGKNPYYRTDSGNDTQDKIFLLNIEEANRYFASKNSRKTANSTYAKKQNSYEENGYGRWWLRSLGYRTNYAALVIPDGSVYSDGFLVDNDLVAVRPALYINLGS